MGEITDINNVFGRNFLCASMVFLPKSIIDFIDDDKKDNFMGLVDTVFVIERNGDNYFMEDDTQACVIHILPKRTLLEENLFMLLKYRDQYPRDSFQFILQKYVKQLNGYRFICQWLFENAERYIVNISNEAQQGFQLQLETFVNHEKEIRQYFPITSPKVDLDSLEPSKEDELSPFDSIMDDEDLVNMINELKEPLDNRAAKKVQIDNLKNEIKANAEKLILATIFNVEFK